MKQQARERALLPLLPAIAAFAETGEVTAAAELLGVPQPTVTRELQRAADLLGTPLHARRGRGAALTAAGEAFARCADDALRALREGMRSVATEPLHGRVRIAFQNILGEDLVPALVRGARTEHPGLEVTLAQGARKHCLELLRTGHADVAFVSPPPTTAGIAVTELLADELVVVVPTEHRLASRRAVPLTEIAQEPLAIMAPGFGLRSTVDDLLRRTGINPPIAFEGQDIHTLVGLASAGLGVTIVPRRDYAGPVRLIRIQGVRAQRTIAMAHPQRDADAPVAAFQAYVAEHGSSVAAALWR